MPKKILKDIGTVLGYKRVKTGRNERRSEFVKSAVGLTMVRDFHRQPLHNYAGWVRKPEEFGAVGGLGRSDAMKVKFWWVGLAAVAVLSLSCSKKSTSSGGGSGFVSTTSIDISGFAFSPLNDSVAVGTTITWTNKDASAHTVTSDQSLFDSGSLGQNQTFSHTFNSTGDFMYHCAVHASMAHGTIRVR